MSQATKAVEWFRGVWASRMTDTVTVTRLSSRGSLNTATMTYTPTSTTIYSGKALVRAPTRPVDRELQDLRSFDQLEIFVPDTVTGIAVGDTVTIDTSSDARLQGVSGTVRAVQADAYVTARRVWVEVDRGAGP